MDFWHFLEVGFIEKLRAQKEARDKIVVELDKLRDDVGENATPLGKGIVDLAEICTNLDHLQADADALQKNGLPDARRRLAALRQESEAIFKRHQLRASNARRAWLAYWRPKIEAMNATPPNPEAGPQASPPRDEAARQLAERLMRRYTSYRRLADAAQAVVKKFHDESTAATQAFGDYVMSWGTRGAFYHGQPPALLQPAIDYLDAARRDLAAGIPDAEALDRVGKPVWVSWLSNEVTEGSEILKIYSEMKQSAEQHAQQWTATQISVAAGWTRTFMEAARAQQTSYDEINLGERRLLRDECPVCGLKLIPGLKHVNWQQPVVLVAT